jgi:hypothetical protein
MDSGTLITAIALTADVSALVFFILYVEIRRSKRQRERDGCKLQHFERHHWRNYDLKSRHWGGQFCTECDDRRSRFNKDMSERYET